MLIFFEDFSMHYHLLKYLEKQSGRSWKIYLLYTRSILIVMHNELPSMRFVMKSSRGRNIQCVRTSLIDAVESFLNVAMSADVWPEPPAIGILQQKFRAECLILLLSIDSGKGTTKLTGKFVDKDSGQSTPNIILLAEAHKLRETFDELSRTFGYLREEIEFSL